MNTIEIKINLTSFIILLITLLIILGFYFTISSKLEVLRTQVNTVEHRYGDYGALKERIIILENNQRRE